MKKYGLGVLVFLVLTVFAYCIQPATVFAQAVLFATPTPTAQQPSQNVDCPANSISNLMVFVPPNQDRSQPSGIRIYGLSEIFRGKRIWLTLISTEPAGQFGPRTYNIPIQVDAAGNADYSTQSLQQMAPDVPEGTYTIQIKGGPITTQSPDGPFVESYPVCMPGFSAEYVLTVTGGEDCLNLGDGCTPGETGLNLCAGAAAAFCDGTQSPPRLRLPDLKMVILNGAACDYLKTPNNVTCAQANATRSVACSAEILTRDDPGNFSEPVSEQTMCCETQLECGKAQGEENSEAGESTMVPFNACRQIPVPPGGGVRAARQRTERNDCCKCTTKNSSSYFIEAEQRCSGEAELFQDQSFTPGLYTAVGCIDSSTDGIITRLVRIGIGISGAIALLMILAGAFMLSTSQGDPKRMGEAKELVSSAVMGLLFIIFSVTILQFIGVTILHIPGFGS